VNGYVGWIGLASSLTLVGFAAAISLWQRLFLEKQILWSAARALIQLLLVGGLLSILFRPGHSLWWPCIWVVGMVVYAGDVARRRAPEVPHLGLLASVACGLSAVITLGVIFGLHVFALQPRTLVPIAGMMIGNSMTAIVLVARRLVEELRDKRDEVEARLALSYPSREAAAQQLRTALRSALSPQIETTKATGLIFLPGAMTGLILAGVPPLQAVLVQAVVMFLILGASAISSVIVALGLLNRVFTHDHRLLPLGRC
jgi:putative ABC transport system permease protein